MIRALWGLCLFAAWSCGSLLAQEFIGPHGFLTLEAGWGTQDSVARRGTFDLHHFNLFGDVLLSPRARLFGEIEFEHRSEMEVEAGESLAGGFVRLERAWFEYRFSSLFVLRLGKFLTPYGIYNEIHDVAPAYDTTILPQSIYGKHRSPQGRMQRFYAKFSLGAQLLGTWHPGSLKFKYQLFVSNGRGQYPYEQDDNANKGMGTRLIGEFGHKGPVIGASFYSDRNGLNANARQTSLGLDFRYEFRRYRLISEVSRFSLEEVPYSGIMRTANAGYIEFAVHIGRQQTVLMRYDVFDPDTRMPHDLEKDWMFGTSYQFIEQALAKFEIHFWDVQTATPRRYIQVLSSLAVVF